MSLAADLVDRVENAPVEFDVDRTTATVTALLVFDALLWWLVYDGAVPMPGAAWVTDRGIPMAAPGAIELGVFHVGTVGAVVGYLAMWGAMMGAMMLPAMIRFARDYARAHTGSHAAAASAVAAFLPAYLLVWAVSGVIPLAFHAALPGGIYGFTRDHTTLVVVGALVLTGAYQLTAFKQAHLRTCCARVEPHDAGVRETFRVGIDHGVRCVLTCFGPFFLLMPFFGEMNLLWMVALAGVVTIERLPTWGRECSVATGITALTAGLLVALLGPSLPVTFAV